MSGQADSTGRLAGRRILIAGAAAGIGRAIALRFAAEGARLALADRDLGGLADLPGAAIGFDALRTETVAPAVDRACDVLGGLDGLVIAIGVFPHAALQDTTLDTWNRTLAVNLTAPFLLAQAAAPHLRASGRAAIVQLGSASAIVPFAGLAAYGASKGGVGTLAKVLAAELAPEVRVNLLCPGMTRTRMVSDWHPDPDALAEVARRTYPLQRIAEPEEIAAAALFLISDEAGFMTGATMTVDGGRTFH